MMLTKTSDEAAIKAKISRVLSGDAEEWDAPDEHYPAGPLIDLVEEIEGVKKVCIRDGGFETNGRQWDWWQEFTYGDKRYTLGGCGYSGGHSFYVSDEQA